MKKSLKTLHRMQLATAFAVGLATGCGGEDPDSPELSFPLAGAPATIPLPAASVAGQAAPTPIVSPPGVPVVNTGTAGGSSAIPPAQPPSTMNEAAQWCGVRDVLASKCTACHSEQKVGGAPMSLKTYADLMAPAVSDNTKKVYQLVGVRVHDTVKPMPPQDKLTTAQLATIDGWVAANAPAGADPTCAAAPPTTPVQEPDATVEWPTNCDASYKILAHGATEGTPYMVAAGAETHPKILIPAPWGNEAVQGIAFRPIVSNAKVLHHWILYGPRGEHLVGWAPGKVPSVTSEDVGLNLAGGQLTLDMHYYNTMGTQAEPDSSGVEICVLKKANFRPNTSAVYSGFSQFRISIPAKSTNFDVTGTCKVNATEPVTLLSASPHAHTFAKHMKFTVTKADGTEILMHDDAFRFEEQLGYPLPKPVVLETGDTVTTVCTYDNPSDRAVTFGENTGNEMCFNFATYYPMGALSCSGGGVLTGGPGTGF